MNRNPHACCAAHGEASAGSASASPASPSGATVAPTSGNAVPTDRAGAADVSPATAAWLDHVRWDDNGLVPAIAQEAATNDVLMVAWMNRDALAATLARGEAVYWSRSRKRLWHKGEESGHTQRVLEIRLDCDQDVVLLKVEQRAGVACHTGRHSCFFERLDGGTAAPHWVAVDPVIVDPESIYK